MAPRVKSLLLGAVLLAGVGAGGYLLTRPPQLEVVRAERGAVMQTVVSSGRVMPPAEIRVGALVSSTVREVRVAEGDMVTTGQLLVQLDDAEAQAGVEQAEAALAQARAGRYEISRVNGPAAAAALRQAEATLAQSQLRRDRDKQLYEQGVLPRVSFDDAATALTVAQAQHDAAQLQVKAASAGGSQAAVAAAGVAQAQARLEMAKVQLARTRIIAPADGVVLARYLEPGDAVVVGSRVLLISRTGATRLVIEPDERNLALLKQGQRAAASAEAFPEQRFDASVQYIAPSVDPQRGTVEVRLAVAEPPDYLRPHMTVSVEVDVGQAKDALLVPRSAVRALASNAPYVWTVVDQRVVRQAVRLGIRGDERVEIVEGVDAGAWVVVDETAELTADARVRMVPTPMAAR